MSSEALPKIEQRPVPLSFVVQQRPKGAELRRHFRGRWQGLEVWVTYIGERTCAVSTEALLEHVERSEKQLARLTDVLVEASAVEWSEPSRPVPSWSTGRLHAGAAPRPELREASDRRAEKDQAKHRRIAAVAAAALPAPAKKAAAAATSPIKAAVSPLAELKHCSKCDRDKPVEEFPLNAGQPSGRGTYCRDCNSKYQREWKAQNKRRQGAQPGPNASLEQLLNAVAQLPAGDRIPIRLSRQLREHGLRFCPRGRHVLELSEFQGDYCRACRRRYENGRYSPSPRQRVAAGGLDFGAVWRGLPSLTGGPEGYIPVGATIEPVAFPPESTAGVVVDLVEQFGKRIEQLLVEREALQAQIESQGRELRAAKAELTWRRALEADLLALQHRIDAALGGGS